MAFGKQSKFRPDLQELSKLCKSFGHPARLHLLELLAEGDKHVNTLTDRTPLARGTVSGHLAILLREDIIQVEEQQLYNEYSLDINRIIEVRKTLDDFIKGAEMRRMGALTDESEVIKKQSRETSGMG